MSELSTVESNFSLVLGGPFYQLWLRSRLARPPLNLLKSRVIVLSLFAWLPLAVLSLLGGRFFEGVKVPFLMDLGTHVRFLFVVPLLVIAELVVHQRLQPIVGEFLRRDIVPRADRTKYIAIVESINRLRNSFIAEMLLLVAVFSLGQLLMRTKGMHADTWYKVGIGDARHFTTAGWWYAFVSVPLMQFLVFRWYYRIVLWFIFLFRVSRLNLQLIPTHPDRAGGLGFVSGSVHAFIALVVAHSALLSSTLANVILFEGLNLQNFKVEIGTFAVLLIVLCFGPLICFTPLLLRTRRVGMREYGRLASHMVRGFDERWVHQNTKNADALMDVGDVQSLADLGNSFNLIREMKPLPFGKEAVIQVAVAFALPLLPLLFTIIPAEELLGRALKMLF